MIKKHLAGTVALLLIALVALLGAAAAEVIVPPGTVVNSPSSQGAAPAGPSSWPDAPDASAASGNVVFNDSFGAGLDAWQSAAFLQGDETSQWKLVKGKLVQNGDAYGDWSDTDALLMSGDVNWSSYVYEANAFATSGSPVGLAWRASDAGMYRVRLYQNLANDKPKARLELVTSTGVKLLATAPVSSYAGYTPGAWQSLKVAANKARQQVWVDGVLLFDVEESTLTSGRIGVLATADGAAAFDNVRVQTAAGAQ